jgi:chromosomal replication initiation ATPase DnaA
VRLVAEARGISPLLLLHPSRCDAPVAEARQLAMYLLHVILQRNYAAIGASFRRDRTTVAHACAHIEDLRDEPGFEREVTALEGQLKALLPAAAGEHDVRA